MNEIESMFPEITTREERRAAKRNPEPDFDCISMGAGVQGTTIALLIAEGRLPKPQYAVFADTGWEPLAVYRQLDRIDRELLAPNGVELVRVSQGNIRDEIIDKFSFNRIPAFTRAPDGDPSGMLRRTCTPHFKLTPIFRWHRQLLGAKTVELDCQKCGGSGERTAPWLTRHANDYDIGPCCLCKGTGRVIRVGAPPKGHWVRSWIGFSVDEVERCAPSPVPYSESWYPLLERGIRFTRDDCLAYLVERGWDDIVKSACIGCPYRSNAEWRDIKSRPDEWAEAVAVDAAIRHQLAYNGTGYLHKDRVPLPLADISGGGDDDNDSERQGCSPYGCRSGDPIEQPPAWDDIDHADTLFEPSGSLWRVMAEADQEPL